MPEFKDKVRFENAKCLRLTLNGHPVCMCPEREDEVVVPENQIDDDSDVYKPGTEGTLIVSEWWATQRGYT